MDGNNLASALDSEGPPSPTQPASSQLSTSINNNFPTAASATASSAASTTAVAGATPKAETDNSPGSGNGISTGALVGGIVAALVVGLALGVLVAVVLRRWRRRKNQYQSPREKKLLSRKDPSSSPSSDSGGNVDGFDSKWLVHLPQAADDSSLRRQTKSLFHQIDLHIENFYENIEVGPLHERAQARLQCYDTGLLSTNVANMLMATRNKKDMIKQCLTYLIVRRISANPPATDTFLPSAVAALPLVLSGPGLAGETRKKRVFAEAYSQWRVLSAYLLSSTTNPNLISAQDADTIPVVDDFTDTFSPWSSVNTAAAVNERKANLREIMRYAVEVGVLLLSQPGLFEFQWPSAPPSGKNRDTANFATAPALLKVADNSGKALARAQVLVDAAVSSGGVVASKVHEM